MSSGQLPRWKQFFPKMKERGAHRRTAMRMVSYDKHWNPTWWQGPNGKGSVPAGTEYLQIEIVTGVNHGGKLTIEET
ncbi:hypothetical protein SEA_PUPPER_12 [Gordonia phage Pupper]|uniref:Uncharacterized protein n=1 Tax=Gordonia phage Pupper TaxID=2571249 RepID=A0A4Y6ERY3_9CAUD|nr:hypothetical protein KHQ83_gp012 [Gordonia phage Pupper]QDF18499.1 hypothetical protein SEA_PUPPER_12 [Gordonia phage Pupper]QDF18732.1 hypothetical protein SEA_SCENTAE_12 [Gordonia phage SCentae]